MVPTKIITKNSSTLELSVRYKVLNKNGEEKGIYHLGRLAPGMADSIVGKFKKGTDIVIIPEIPNSFDLDQQTYSITNNGSSFEKKFVITLPDVRHLDEANTPDNIRNSFYELNSIDFGFKKMDLKGALDSYCGALIVVEPPKVKGQAGSQLLYLQPSDFSSKMLFDDFNYVSSSDSKKIEVSKSTALSVSASFPMVANLFSEASQNSYSQLFWDIQGFGWVTKKEQPNWSYITAYHQLSPEKKSAIISTLKEHPTAFLVYINKVYAIRDMKYQCVKGNKVKDKTQISQSNVWTTNGLYDFKHDATQDTRFSQIAYDIDGIIFKVDTNNNGLSPYDIKDLLNKLGSSIINIKIDPSKEYIPARKIVNLEELKSRLRNLKGGILETSIVPITELVEGQKGSYYYVDLYSDLLDISSVKANNRKQFSFNEGQCCNDISDPQFKDAFAKFYSVYDSLVKFNANVKVYVKGGANRKPMSHKIPMKCCDYGNQSIDYFPKSENDDLLFIPKPLKKIIPKQLTNSDLPYSRAMFIKERLSSIGISSVILESSPSTSNSDYDRNAIIYLYVE